MARQIRLIGAKELEAHFAKLVADIAGKGQKAGLALKEVVRDAAEPVAEAARQNVNDVTGKLRSAIFASRGDASKASAIVGVNHRIAPHGHLVEFGHGGPHPAGPHPFMRPAVEANRSVARKIIGEGITEIVDKYK